MQSEHTRKDIKPSNNAGFRDQRFLSAVLNLGGFATKRATKIHPLTEHTMGIYGQWGS
jgi:hypothetical protein